MISRPGEYHHRHPSSSAVAVAVAVASTNSTVTMKKTKVMSMANGTTYSEAAVDADGGGVEEDEEYEEDTDTTTTTTITATTLDYARLERRSLLPLSTEVLNRVGITTSTTTTNNGRRNDPRSNRNATKRSRLQQQQQQQKQRQHPAPISIRRKRHDLRLHAILNTASDDDPDEEYDNDENSHRRPHPDDWMRPYWLGLGLFLILCAFWILDTLKDPLFGALLPGGLQYNLPRAKLLSVGTTLVLVIVLEYIAHEQQKQQQQQQQQQLESWPTTTETLEPDDSIAVVPERSKEDVLDGGGTWTRMHIGTFKTYNRKNQSTSDHDTNNDQTQQRSQIFITIGVPFCIFFAMIAYFLQFNPNTAWTVSHTTATTGTTTTNESGTTTTTTTSTNMDMDPVTKQAWRVLGYCLYAAIESFGSLMVATFWSYTNSTLTIHDAESYYGTIIAFAQLGAIVGSTMVTVRIWNSITLLIVACLVLLLHIIVMITYNRKFPPTTRSDTPTKVSSSTRYDSSLHEYDTTTTTTTTAPTENDDDEPILKLSGVRLILKHNYVLLILGVSCLYEVSLTCLNYQMTLLGWSKFEESGNIISTTTPYDVSASSPSSPTTSAGSSFIDVMSFTQFMGHYGQMVNVSSLLLSSLIFPTLIYRLGLKYTLRLFPTLLLFVNILAFIAMPGNLLVLFFSMSLLKATTYSIHDPAKEILYIPTSQAIQFNAKFWIDVVGARVAKAIGSSINHYSGSVHRSIRVASAPSLLTAMGLWYVCYCIGSQFDTLIESNTVVGIDDDDDDEIDGSIRKRYKSSHNNPAEYSHEHDDDNEGPGVTPESTASYELTAL
jgi:ATP/ADP translocase